jgi:hypothetical protein
MKREEITQLPKEKLVPLLEVCLRGLHAADGLWFLEVEKVLGTERAIELDRNVWIKLGAREAQHIRRNFNLQEDGIPLLTRALRFAPGLISFTEFNVEQISDTEAVLRVTNCYPQRARLRDGLGLFDCHPVDEAYLRSFAQALNPKIMVRCELCPPHNYTEEVWCQWHFSLGEESG